MSKDKRTAREILERMISMFFMNYWGYCCVENENILPTKKDREQAEQITKLILNSQEFIDAVTKEKGYVKLDDLPANILKYTPFPECTNNCGLIKILGIGECENVEYCQWKHKEQV